MSFFHYSILIAIFSSFAFCQASHELILPPELPWNGKSISLIVDQDDPWITPAEKSGFKTTPSYKETIIWLNKLVDASEYLQLVSIGKSDENRDIWMVVASKEKLFSAQQLHASKKPIFLAQGGIHSGEIDGKDAGMMLLRDMTVRGTKTELLDKAHFLFIPILSVDGHERFSKYNRVNQRGPEAMGWRTNSRNLNLNRDYAKLDTPENQAIVKVINQWQPDMYYDIHVTDGADYQYDITFGYNGGGFVKTNCYATNIAKWFDNVLNPAISKDLTDAGHIPGPLVFAVDGNDITKGVEDWTATPRYSQGYGDARYLPSLLIENHSLKPYRQRVLGTYVLLESTLHHLGAEVTSLRAAINKDKLSRSQDITLKWEETSLRELQKFAGVSFRIVDCPITGNKQQEWTGTPQTLELPIHYSPGAAITVQRPKAYWIPGCWKKVIERLKIHGIQMEYLTEPKTVKVEMYRVTKSETGKTPFEGHTLVSADTVKESMEWTFAPGSVRIDTDQPLGLLAILLLEPDSPDSFFQWGFFIEILQQTEYIEAYVMRPIAQRMLQEDPSLQQEFSQKLKDDPDFAKSAYARLRWFYEKTPFYDKRWRLYPVAREIE